jgi:glutathione S-transferase
MNRDDIIRMAREAGLYFKDDDMICEWLDELRCFAALVRADERNKLAAWMMAQGYATGHGDTMEQLLEELGGQAIIRMVRVAEERVKAEREACAKVCEGHDELKYAIQAIRARGQA